MKCMLIVVAYCLALTAAWPAGKPTGQPGCQTDQELAAVNYPHFYLKNHYWVCESLGVPARLAVCPVASGYLDDAKSCVPWALWYWTPTQAPPSEPAVAV